MNQTIEVSRSSAVDVAWVSLSCFSDSLLQLLISVENTFTPNDSLVYYFICLGAT